MGNLFLAPELNNLHFSLKLTLNRSCFVGNMKLLICLQCKCSDADAVRTSSRQLAADKGRVLCSVHEESRRGDASSHNHRREEGGDGAFRWCPKLH